MFSALSHEKTMMFVLLVFITVVAIFCVTNTLIVITVQKTNEIGLLKAVGFSSGRIMAAFVWHGWIQCLAGIAAGIGVGLLVLDHLNDIASWLTALNVEVFPKEIYRLNEIPWSTSFGELARIALFVMAFCTLSSILPAYRAARLDPVEALRNE
jgi:lipoprotein-releasing system permease protein